ncbi:MAG: hypothetical protein JRJ24_18945 [Deltaproteobacteria bacterium]|nr:hypothetical protein [Deltaproteobacteria bacterium]
MMRAFKILAAILILGLVALVAVGYSLNDPRPKGQQGPEADALARSMEAAVNKDAWDKTGAVRWSFFEQHRYVWDRERDLVELQWGESRALFRTADQSGRVWSKGIEQTGADAEEALRAAYAYWINDSFWLNPVVKFFDPGVERSLVKLDDGRDALLISYVSGGVTPGDAYLWIPDTDGMPASWRMWVQIIPIGGIETTWEGWVELSTGAKVATQHEGWGRMMTFISDVEGAENLDALGVESGLFDALLQD